MNVNRRQWLRMSIGAALATTAWPALAAVKGAREGPMNMTVVPSTGERIPAVGIGTVGFQGDPSAAAGLPLRQTLETFYRLGGRLIDTSPNYGDSEMVLGELLTDLGIREAAFMATKVDRESRAEGEQRMEESFGRLGSPIDLMQVHNLRGVDAMLPALQDWREQGRFRYIGITTHRASQHPEIEHCMRSFPLDFVQVNYSLADRAAAERILPLAMDKGIAVLVNRPFGKGQLFAAVKGRQLPDWSADIDAESWAQLFLKYIISHPAATLPIPGTTKPHHAEDNMGALYGRLPDAALRTEMEHLVDRLL